MTDFDFDQLGEHIAREQDALLTKHNVQAEVRSRIAELDVGTLRKSARTAATKRAGMIWAAGGVTLAAAAAVLISLRGLDADMQAASQTLSVQIAEQHTNVEVGQYVQAPTAKQIGLQFSDGSHIEVAESSRARLMGLRSNGADVSLESGLMHVQVKHRTDTSWHISAGPFGVNVIGTRFDVRWKPEEDSFELTLHEGKVELSGCAFNSGYRMPAGRTVRASCKNERFGFSSKDDIAAPAAGSGSVETESFGQTQTPEPRIAPQIAPTEAPAKAEADEAAPATGQRLDKPARPQTIQTVNDAPDFRVLARAGKYAEALRAAKAAGFEQECAKASARDLSVLASAARYAQDTVSETYAWRLLRERFRGTKDGSIAAFALGRIEFDNHGAYAKAAEWFRTYLREQPRGDLTREALGRLLEATQHLGDQPQVRELAARYLQEYPDGPHATIAQRLSERGDAR